MPPDSEIEGTDPNAKPIAIALDDASYLISPNYNYWVIWSLPVQIVISEGIPRGGIIASFGGVVQGIAYGRNRYKGPKPPLRSIYTYVFTALVLDRQTDLAPDSREQDLLRKVEGYTLQRAKLSGKFQSHRE